MLSEGDADLGICTEALRDVPTLAAIPYYSWHHAVIAPKGHALEKIQPLTLEAIAQWPIITYHEGFTGRRNVDETFARAGLELDIVISAMDTDVLKAYVELGLGVGIIAAMAFDPKRDTGLVRIEAEHLFKPNTALIAVRRGNILRNFAYRFIELCSPASQEKVVRAAVLADQGKADTVSRRRIVKLSSANGNTFSGDEIEQTA